jgi:DNA-binding transcriptional regulator WhiA
MQNLCKLFNYTGTICESNSFDSRTNKTYYSVSFAFVSHKVKQILETFGIVPRKSLTLCYPTAWENDEMRRNYIRGYMDGRVNQLLQDINF